MTRKSYKAAQQNIITRRQARSILPPASSGTSIGNDDPFAGLIVTSPSIGSSSGQGSVPSQALACSPVTLSAENVQSRSVRKRKNTSTTTVAATGSATHIRGLCTMRSTAARVAKEGRIKMTWDNEMNVPYYPGKTKDSLSWDIGAIVRAHVPMDQITYSGHKEAALQIVIDHLSAYYEIDLNDDRIYAYIQKSAANIYRHYKSYCHMLYKEQRSVQPVPVEFQGVEKEKEWFFLCAHFETPEFKKKSEKMTNAAKSKKKFHKAGPISYGNMACKFAKEGHHAPLMKAHAKAYPDYSNVVMDAADAELKEMEASYSTSVGQMSSVENENVNPPQLRIPIARQVQLMLPIAGSEAGTRYRGFGDVQVREPLVRGPSKGGGKVIQSELAALKEKVLVAERERDEERRARDEERRASIAMEERLKRLEALVERCALPPVGLLDG